MDNSVPQKVQESIFEQLLNHPENKVCADCPNKSPTWASIDFGVFVCLRCAGVHRQLGPNVSRVRSAKLDSWPMDFIEIMAATGNKIANDYWECNLPSYYKQPDISTSMEEVRRLVDEKYIKRKYTPKDYESPIAEFIEARKNNKTTAGAFRQMKLTGNQYESKSSSSSTSTPTQNVSSAQKVETKSSNQNLLEFDEGDSNGSGNVTSAPKKGINFAKFNPSSNSEQQKQSTSNSNDLLTFDFGGSITTATATTTQPEQKKKVDAFEFIKNNKSQQQQQPIQTDNSAKQIDSTNLYNMYKTGNTADMGLSNQTNNTNYSGGNSNYAYLDMIGGQHQKNQFNQQKPQGYGQQNNSFTTGQNNNSFGGYGYQNNNQINQNSGFGGGFSNKTSTGGYGGGFSGQPTTNNFGFQPNNSFGGGFSTSTNTGYYGVQSQQSQQGFYTTSSTTTAFTF